MEPAVLIVAANHLAAEVRAHFFETGHDLVWSRWKGRGSALCFELAKPGGGAPPATTTTDDASPWAAPEAALGAVGVERPEPMVLPEAASLASALATTPFRDAIPPELSEGLGGGPLTSLGEQLSRTMRVDVLMVLGEGAAQVLVVWIAGRVQEIHLVDGARLRSWAGGELQSREVAGRSGWREAVETYIATRPVARTAGGDETDTIPIHVGGARQRAVVWGMTLAFFGWTALFRAAGESLGSANVGGTVGFLSAGAIFTVVLWKGGFIQRPSAIGPPLALGASGIALMGLARALSTSGYGEMLALVGMMALVSAVVWTYTKIFRRDENEYLPED